MALLCGAPALAAAPGGQPAPASDSGPPSIDAFFDDPTFDGATLSPDGALLAFVYVKQDDKGELSTIAVEHLDSGQIDVVTKLTTKGMTVTWLAWKDNNRLLVGLNILDVKRTGDKPSSEIVSYKYGNFIVAVDRDGGHVMQMLKSDSLWNSQRGAHVGMLDRLKNDPDHILAVAPNTAGYSAAYRVDVHTGLAVQVEPGQGDVTSWTTDSTGAIVARTRFNGEDWVVEGRAPGEKKWTQIARLNRKELKALDDIDFLGAAEKPNQFYVVASAPGEPAGDTRRLRIYDVATKTLGDAVWPKTSSEIESIVYEEGNTGRLAGVCYTVDTHVCEFNDHFVSVNYKGLVKYFQGDQNVVPLSMQKGARWWLLNVSGPSNPGAYYLYDTTRAKIVQMGDRFEKLPSERLGVTERFSYKARDGVAIPGYLTRPPGAPKGPMPLVVMPHGGPEARDSFEYEAWSQILATRGYMVLQPNFRGSGGYGTAYADAGHRQWAGRMANDITDGVQALIASGQADPNRICIFGASYGGYAALFAGATHPELYKCVVSWAGASDLMASLAFERRTHGRDSFDYRYWVKLIGDPDKDAAAIRAASPVTYAATYRPAVLLIHGDADRIVDPEQSRYMSRALSRAGHPAKLVIFADEGHPEFGSVNQKKAFAMVVDFISEHIAPAKALSTVAPPAAAPPLPVH
jgi:dipeptidyl aminopeptidase/acylaminoacyl peptidase